MEVKPEQLPMPTLGPTPGETPPASRKSAPPRSEPGKPAPPRSEPGKPAPPWTGPDQSAFPPPNSRKPSQSESGKSASSPAGTTQR
jgi:hypothetical protein